MSEYYNDPHRYDDIINLPHHQSVERAHMSLYDRAAQFAPFAALTGYEDAIEETARLTEDQIILDEGDVSKINEILYELSFHLSEKKNVSVRYFEPDSLKSGGAYVIYEGCVKKIDEVEQTVVFQDGKTIQMEHITEVTVKSKADNYDKGK